jgi:hypothetical protein
MATAEQKIKPFEDDSEGISPREIEDANKAKYELVALLHPWAKSRFTPDTGSSLTNGEIQVRTAGFDTPIDVAEPVEQIVTREDGSERRRVVPENGGNHYKIQFVQIGDEGITTISLRYVMHSNKESFQIPSDIRLSGNIKGNPLDERVLLNKASIMGSTLITPAEVSTN